MPSVRWNDLDLNETEIDILRRALKAYQHLGLGNFVAACDAAGPSSFVSGDVQVLLEDAREQHTGSRHGGPSIGSPTVTNDVRIARRLEALLTGDNAVRLYSRDGSVD